MTKVLQRLELSLRSFYIFNSKYGKNEGEEYKKVLYYNPNDIELNTKIKDVGLSEAIVAFTGTFTTDDNCKALHTQKTTQLFHQPEPDFWMVLVINVPKELRAKDGVEMAEYRGAEVNDRIYQAVLERCYTMFRLTHGTFASNMEVDTDSERSDEDGEGSTKSCRDDARREKLQARLTEFYDEYLSTLKLTGCDIMDFMGSIQYLPLDRYLFLRSHNFMYMISAAFPSIRETVLFFNDQVVCCGKTDPSDLYNLQEYLLQTWWGPPKSSVSDSANHPPILRRSDSIAAEIYRNGAFVTGPERSEEPASVKPPCIYLQQENDSKLKAFKLVIYRALKLTLCLFVDDQQVDACSEEFFKELHSFAGPQLTSIATDIDDSMAKPKKSLPAPAGTSAAASGSGKASIAAVLPLPSSPTDAGDASAPKYLFLNELYLKHETNLALDSGRRRRAQGSKAALSIPANVMNIMADLSNMLADDKVDDEEGEVCIAPPPIEEILIKTPNDFWVVKRRCNWRQFFIIICSSKATLLDITNEAKRIFESDITNGVYVGK